MDRQTNGPTWKNVLNGTCLPRGQQLWKIILKSMHKCKSYGTDKLNIWPLWNLFDPCDLDLQHIWKNISNGNSPPRGQQLCKIILKSMHKMYQLWPGQAQFMTILTFIWPLWPWPSNYLNKCFEWHFFSSKQQLCKTILKSMHKCTSYGPDKLNILPFWPLFDPCDLDLQLPKKMFQKALLLLKGNSSAKLFWNPYIIV